MEINLEEKISKAKEEAKTNPQKSKKCHTCKKKKNVVEKLPEIEITYIPSPEDIKKAYSLLSNVKEEEKQFINEVYRFIFNEEFDFTCKSCANTQGRKFGNYIKKHLQ